MDILLETASIKEKVATLDNPLPISNESVDIAWKARRTLVKSKEDVFLLVAGLSLLNAAIKTPGHKESIHYAGIKLSLVNLISQIISADIPLVDDFWINPKERNCVYIETFGFQFTFHNVSINPIIDTFINSPKNVIKPWSGIRLQRVAEDVFLLSMKCRVQQRFNQANESL